MLRTHLNGLLAENIRHLQVALLFLAKGPLLLESIWTQWLGSAAHMAPASVVCGTASPKCLQKGQFDRQNIYEEQSFFSIYVIIPSEYGSFANSSIFGNRVIAGPEQVSVKFASPWSVF